MALRLNPRDWHREANLTEDFPVRLRARRKRQDPRNGRLLQSIATVLINSRCSPSIPRSCLKNVALSPHRDEHQRHCLVCSIPCDRSRAVSSDAVCHPRNALHQMCFQRSDPLFSQCHMETFAPVAPPLLRSHKAMPSTPPVQCFPGGEPASLTTRVEARDLPSPSHHSQYFFITFDAQHICYSIRVARGSCCCTRSRPNAN